MSRTVIILDDTSDGQKLGLAMLQAIGAMVDSVKFTTVDELPPTPDRDTIYCPLTSKVPATFEFWGSSIVRLCQDIDELRHLAAARIGIKVGAGGNLWLPVIWTVRAPICGQIISKLGSEPAQRSIQLDALALQQLHQFGYQLLTQIDAPPAVYLVQFSQVDRETIFDRLFPFPAAPALASVGIQQPNLFAAHWRCITRQCNITPIQID